MVTVALFIIGVPVLLLWLDFRLRRVREELARERASRAEAVEAARAEGFLRGVSRCPAAGVNGTVPAASPEEGRVPAGASEGAR